MKILYAIQGTGNGHLCRAMDIIPCLKSFGEVDVLISGIQADIALPFDVKYRFHGLSFIFGKKGGIDFWRTYVSSKMRKFVKEINAVPIQDYDLVINDFEPISAWACHLKEKKCVGLSHQIAVLDSNSPKPMKTDHLGKLILKNYAPAKESYGFHFQSYSPQIYTPVIRQAVRKLKSTNQGHYTVYLPAYDDARIIKQLSRFSEIKWQVFSKHNKKPISSKNITIYPINNDAFIESMSTSAGILCGAGFETPAEALYLKKKLMVIPMKNQYEQQLNAAALKKMGVPVIKSLKKKYTEDIKAWLEDKSIVEVDYPDMTEYIIETIIKKHT